jgi:hypothetical protein
LNAFLFEQVAGSAIECKASADPFRASANLGGAGLHEVRLILNDENTGARADSKLSISAVEELLLVVATFDGAISFMRGEVGTMTGSFTRLGIGEARYSELKHETGQ